MLWFEQGGNWGKRMLDLVLPRSSLLKNLEEMSAADLSSRIVPKYLKGDSSIAFFFSYRDTLIRAAIWQIKYRNDQRVVKMLAQVIHEELLVILVEKIFFENFSNPILIPIPLSAARLKARGYNQTENLVREMAKLDGGKNFQLLTNVLTKIKETLPQSSLPRPLRLQNLKNCFRLNSPEKICKRNIVLLDDVVTTGATLREAATTLRLAGAHQILSIAVAH